MSFGLGISGALEGASKGADLDIEVARKRGLQVYTCLESIPQA